MTLVRIWSLPLCASALPSAGPPSGTRSASSTKGSSWFTRSCRDRPSAPCVLAAAGSWAGPEAAHWDKGQQVPSRTAASHTVGLAELGTERTLTAASELGMLVLGPPGAEERGWWALQAGGRAGSSSRESGQKQRTEPQGLGSPPGPLPGLLEPACRPKAS